MRYLLHATTRDGHYLSGFAWWEPFTPRIVAWLGNRLVCGVEFTTESPVRTP